MVGQCGLEPFRGVGISEQEVFLVTVDELREPDGQSEHELLDTANDPAPESCVDANAQSTTHVAPASGFVARKL